MATILTQADTARPATGGYKVDISRDQRIGRVSSEWFSRPDDERFLSLSSLYAAVEAHAERATARTVETRAVRVEANRDDAERLALLVPGRDGPVVPTHWSFGQLCSLIGTPSGYLRQLPAPLSALADTRLEPDLEDLLWGITNVFHRAGEGLERELDRNEHDQRRLQREQDGSEISSVELETATAVGRSMLERRDAMEAFRDAFAEQFRNILASHGSRDRDRSSTGRH